VTQLSVVVALSGVVVVVVVVVVFVMGGSVMHVYANRHRHLVTDDDNEVGTQWLPMVPI
jgi:hypothetical protein